MARFHKRLLRYLSPTLMSYYFISPRFATKHGLPEKIKYPRRFDFYVEPFSEYPHIFKFKL